MARVGIEELTDDEVRVRDTSRFFRPAYAETDVPGPANNRFVAFGGVILTKELTDEEMNDLEQAISSLPYVSAASLLIGPDRIPLDRVPADARLQMFVQAGFDMTED